MTVDDLYIVNYCHRSCTPLRNIMRLPKDEAFALAHEMAAQNNETTAFYRFADFENYYPERLKTDMLLYTRFIELGGKPLQEHPLSSVLKRQGAFTMLTKDMLFRAISDYNGTLEEFIINVENQYHYMEVQIWNDECLRTCSEKISQR